MSIVLIPPVHDLYLAKVDRLAANADVGNRLIIEPHSRFEPAFIRHLFPADGAAEISRVNNILINEIPVSDWLSKSLQHPIWHRNLIHPLADDLEDARFQNH